MEEELHDLFFPWRRWRPSSCPTVSSELRRTLLRPDSRLARPGCLLTLGRFATAGFDSQWRGVRFAAAGGSIRGGGLDSWRRRSRFAAVGLDSWGRPAADGR
jgi:hypothetical protein